MLVDHEKAWQVLKKRMQGREGIGTGKLLALMSEVEVECQVEEGVPERALRLYGVEFHHDLLTHPPSGSPPALTAAHAPSSEGSEAALPRGDASEEEERDSHAAGAGAAAN